MRRHPGLRLTCTAPSEALSRRCHALPITNAEMERQIPKGPSSTQSEVLKRSASDTVSDVGFDDQFEDINAEKVHLILFNFAYPIRRTKIPLLTNDLSNSAPAIRRAPQNELLCASRFVFLENKVYASELLGVIEDQANRLAARCCRAPALRTLGRQGGLDGKIIVFGRDLDHRCTVEV